MNTYKQEVHEKFWKSDMGQKCEVPLFAGNIEPFLDSLIDEVGVKAYSEGYTRGEDRVESTRKMARFEALKEAEEAIKGNPVSIQLAVTDYLRNEYGLDDNEAISPGEVEGLCIDLVQTMQQSHVLAIRSLQAHE